MIKMCTILTLNECILMLFDIWMKEKDIDFGAKKVKLTTAQFIVLFRIL